MNPYNNVYSPPVSSDESYFNYALGSHLRFSFFVLLLLVVLLTLLWNTQPWFKIQIVPADQSSDETTQGTNGQDSNLPLQNNEEWSDYRVRPGDTLSEIAKRYGVGLSVLLRFNGLADPNLVQAGHHLKIPRRK